jgi:hypothetical protein
MRQTACTLWFVIVLSIGLAPGVSAGELPRLRSGPMVGYGEMTEVMLWVQTTAPATVSYRFWPESDTAAAVMSNPVRTTIEEYHRAHARNALRLSSAH